MISAWHDLGFISSVRPRVVNLAGTQLKHMNQLNEGYTPPKLSNDNFITPIKPQRAQELAKSAFHFSLRIAAFFSLDIKSSDLKDKVETWYQASGYKYVLLDPKAQPCPDDDEEFEEET